MSLNSTVVSLVPFDIREEKPGLIPSRFFIPASNMKSPSILKVGTCNHFVYLDETRGSLQVRNPSDIVAKSIVEDYNSSQLGISDDAKPALFFIDEDVSAEEVIKSHKLQVMKALSLQKRWFLNIAMIADNDWSRYHQHNVVSDFQRKIADILGWSPKDHEWMAPHTTMKAIACPACGISVPEGMVICSSCKCVLDSEKFKTLQFAS